jgi:hypothetical protein
MRRSESTLRLTAGAAAVVFAWAGDRWRHVVTVADGVYLVSLEGPADPAGDPRWPASPVFTEVSRVEVAGRPAILGVGCSGRSHFSASVTVHPTVPDTLLFEVACRLQEPPAWIGSTYTRADGSTVQVAPVATPPTGSALPRTSEWRYVIGPAGLQPQSGER